MMKDVTHLAEVCIALAPPISAALQFKLYLWWIANNDKVMLRCGKQL